MTIARYLVPAVVAVVLTACGASTGTSSSPAATGSSSSLSSSPTFSATPMSCPEFDVTAAHLLTYVHYVSLDVGTDNDPSSYVDEMRQAVAELIANAPSCAAKAGSALTALSAANDALAGAYQPGAGAAQVAADKAALAAYVSVAKAAWTAMGKDPSPWDTELKYSV